LRRHPGLLDTGSDEFQPRSRRFFWQDGEFVETPAFLAQRKFGFADSNRRDRNCLRAAFRDGHTVHRFIGKAMRRVRVRATWRPESCGALRTSPI